MDIATLKGALQADSGERKYMIKKEKEYVIEFNAQGGSSVLGRLKRLLIFPFVWVLTGKAKL